MFSLVPSSYNWSLFFWYSFVLAIPRTPEMSNYCTVLAHRASLSWLHRWQMDKSLSRLNPSQVNDQLTSQQGDPPSFPWCMRHQASLFFFKARFLSSCLFFGMSLENNTLTHTDNHTLGILVARLWPHLVIVQPVTKIQTPKLPVDCC